MKTFLFIFLMLAGVLQAQINFTAVMVDTNGAIQRPTNFWSANSAAISSNAVLNSTSTISTLFIDAPDRFRNLSHAMSSELVTAAAQTHSTLIEGRLDLRIVNGDTNASACIRVNRGGPWNGTSGNSAIDWSKSFTVTASGSKSIATNNQNHAFLVLGADLNLNNRPTNGNFVGLLWTNSTNARVIIGSNNVVTTNGNIATSLAADFILWIEHKTNGTGNIYYAEDQGGAVTVKPASPSFSYTNGPTAVSSSGQTSLTFGLVTVSSNSNFDIVGLRNVLLFAP